MAGQVRGIERQYESATFNKDFRKRLSPATIRMMEELEGKAAPAAGAGNIPPPPPGFQLVR